MKNTVFATIILFLFFLSCKNPNGYTIKGRIQNAAGEVLYLDALVDIALKPIDSIKIQKDGTFQFSGLIYEPEFFILRTSKNDLVTFVIHPSNELTINADYKNFGESCRIIGSEECRLMQEYSSKFMKCNKQLDSLSIIYRNNQLSPKLDSLKTVLDKKFASIRNDLENYTKKFIHDHSYTFAAVYALYHEYPVKEPLLNPLTSDISYYELVDSCLRQKYPSSLQVKSLERFIKKKKQLAEELKSKDKIGGIGTIAPNIYIPNRSGDTLNLYSLREKYYVLVYFWASWSRPCKIDLPILMRNYAKYHEKGFEIYAVSVDNKREMWTEALDKEKLPWINVCDLKGWNTISARLYGVKSLPATVLIDVEGKIIARDLRGEELNEKLDALFSVE